MVIKHEAKEETSPFGDGVNFDQLNQFAYESMYDAKKSAESNRRILNKKHISSLSVENRFQIAANCFRDALQSIPTRSDLFFSPFLLSLHNFQTSINWKRLMLLHIIALTLYTIIDYSSNASLPFPSADSYYHIIYYLQWLSIGFVLTDTVLYTLHQNGGNKVNVMLRIAYTGLLIADQVILTVAQDFNMWRLSRPIVSFGLMFYYTKLEKQIYALANCLHHLFDTFFLMGLCTSFFGFVAYRLGEDCEKLEEGDAITTLGGRPFSSYPLIAANLASFLSGDNYPDIALPSYRNCYDFTIPFLIIFGFIGIIFLANVPIATVIDFYKSYRAVQLLEERRQERKSLLLCFYICMYDKGSRMREEEFKKLLAHVYKGKVINQEAASRLFTICDEACDDVLDPVEFLEVRDVLLWIESPSEFAMDPVLASWQRFQSFCNEKLHLHTIVHSLSFQLFFDILVLISLATVIADMKYSILEEEYSHTIQIIDLTLLLLFSLECLLKLISLGPHKYFNNGWNVLDFTVVLICIISDSLLAFFSKYAKAGRYLKLIRLTRSLRTLRVLRLLRILRPLLNVFHRLQHMLRKILLCIPTLLSVVAIILMLTHSYACIGHLLYGSNDTILSIEGQPFSQTYNEAVIVKNIYEQSITIPKWWLLSSFATVSQAMVAMMQITFSSGWVRTMFLYGELAGYWQAFLFFFSGYMFIILVCVSLLTSVLIETFSVVEFASNFMGTMTEKIQSKLIKKKTNDIMSNVRVFTRRRFGRSSPVGMVGKGKEVKKEQKIGEQKKEENGKREETLTTNATPMLEGEDKKSFAQMLSKVKMRVTKITLASFASNKGKEKSEQTGEEKENRFLEEELKEIRVSSTREAKSRRGEGKKKRNAWYSVLLLLPFYIIQRLHRGAVSLLNKVYRNGDHWNEHGAKKGEEKGEERIGRGGRGFYLSRFDEKRSRKKRQFIRQNEKEILTRRMFLRGIDLSLIEESEILYLEASLPCSYDLRSTLEERQITRALLANRSPHMDKRRDAYPLLLKRCERPLKQSASTLLSLLSNYLLAISKAEFCQVIFFDSVEFFSNLVVEDRHLENRKKRSFLTSQPVFATWRNDLTPSGLLREYYKRDRIISGDDLNEKEGQEKKGNHGHDFVTPMIDDSEQNGVAGSGGDEIDVLKVLNDACSLSHDLHYPMSSVLFQSNDDEDEEDEKEAKTMHELERKMREDLVSSYQAKKSATANCVSLLPASLSERTSMRDNPILPPEQCPHEMEETMRSVGTFDLLQKEFKRADAERYQRKKTDGTVSSSHSHRVSFLERREKKKRSSAPSIQKTTKNKDPFRFRRFSATPPVENFVSPPYGDDIEGSEPLSPEEVVLMNHVVSEDSFLKSPPVVVTPHHHPSEVNGASPSALLAPSLPHGFPIEAPHSPASPGHFFPSPTPSVASPSCAKSLILPPAPIVTGNPFISKPFALSWGLHVSKGECEIHLLPSNTKSKKLGWSEVKRTGIPVVRNPFTGIEARTVFQCSGPKITESLGCILPINIPKEKLEDVKTEWEKNALKAYEVYKEKNRPCAVNRKELMAHGDKEEVEKSEEKTLLSRSIESVSCHSEDQKAQEPLWTEEPSSWKNLSQLLNSELIESSPLVNDPFASSSNAILSNDVRSSTGKEHVEPLLDPTTQQMGDGAEFNAPSPVIEVFHAPLVGGEFPQIIPHHRDSTLIELRDNDQANEQALRIPKREESEIHSRRDTNVSSLSNTSRATLSPRAKGHVKRTSILYQNKYPKEVLSIETESSSNNEDSEKEEDVKNPPVRKYSSRRQSRVLTALTNPKYINDTCGAVLLFGAEGTLEEWLSINDSISSLLSFFLRLRLLLIEELEEKFACKVLPRNM